MWSLNEEIWKKLFNQPQMLEFLEHFISELMSIDYEEVHNNIVVDADENDGDNQPENAGSDSFPSTKQKCEGGGELDISPAERFVGRDQRHCHLRNEYAQRTDHHRNNSCFGYACE